MREVAPERTSWRDLRLNARHRQWDFHCPAVDVDMLMLEYTSGRVCALVEYKNEQATTQDMSHASYRALVDLGNRAEVPVFFIR